MSTPADLTKLQRAALYRLFSALFWRGRQAARNRPVKGAVIARRKYLPLLLYVALGCMLLPFAVPKIPWVIFSTMPHAVTLMLTGMTMAAACGTLLFNDQESDILLHRPVPVRLILMAKVRVLVTESLSMGLALNAVIMIAGLMRGDGAWRYIPAHLFSIMLLTLFTVATVVLTFQLCLKLFGREKLNNLLTASQVLMAMVFMLGSQLAPRMMRTTHLEQWEVSRWLFALPPAWFGAIDTLAVTLRPTLPLVIEAVGAVLLTTLFCWLAFVRLAGTYEEAVVAMNDHSSAPSAPAESGRARWAERLTRLPVMRWWLRDPVERVGFLLATVQLTRTRDVKLRIYPQVGQFTIYPIIFAVGGGSQSGGMAAPFAAGFLGMIALNTVMLLRYSEEYRGSDVFRYAPLTSPASLFFGARKALVLFALAPVVLIWTILLLAMSRDWSTLIVLIPGIMVAHVLSLLPAVTSPLLPFSETQADSKAQGSAVLRLSLGMFGAMILAGITWLASSQGLLLVWLAVITVLTLLCDFLFRRRIRAQPIASDE